MSSPARSPARSSAGPLVERISAPISWARSSARVVFPSPGRAGQQDVLQRLAAHPRRLDEDREVLAQPVLADELAERARAQADLPGALGVLRVGIGPVRVLSTWIRLIRRMKSRHRCGTSGPAASSGGCPRVHRHGPMEVVHRSDPSMESRRCAHRPDAATRA